MGIRGFIRNTVEAVRRFFNGPEIKDDLDHDSGSIHYSDKSGKVVEKGVREGFFIDPIVPAFNEKLFTDDWLDGEVAVSELAAGDWSDEEVVVGELAAGDRSDEEVVDSEVVDSEVVDGKVVVDELVVDELVVGNWSDEKLKEGVVEMPSVVEIPPKESQHRPVSTVVELAIFNYPVDKVSKLDQREPDNHAVEPQCQRVPAIVEIDVSNYPVDTEEEMQAYLNEVISIEDSGYQREEESEIEVAPVPYDVEESENYRPVHIQSGREQVTLTSALESLLFVAESAVDAAHLAKILTLSTEQITEALQTLDRSYAATCRGVRIQNHEDKFQLVTAPPAASIVEDFLSFNLSTRLSGPALEALAVIAYRQPVTRAQVEAVRGVDCASVLRSLIQLGLIEESGRLETLGRPILYSVTELFMQHFGLLKMSELPPLELKEEDLLLSTIESSEL